MGTSGGRADGLAGFGRVGGTGRLGGISGKTAGMGEPRKHPLPFPPKYLQRPAAAHPQWRECGQGMCDVLLDTDGECRPAVYQHPLHKLSKCLSRTNTGQACLRLLAESGVKFVRHAKCKSLVWSLCVR